MYEDAHLEASYEDAMSPEPYEEFDGDDGYDEEDDDAKEQLEDGPWENADGSFRLHPVVHDLDESDVQADSDHQEWLHNMTIEQRAEYEDGRDES